MRNHRESRTRWKYVIVVNLNKKPYPYSLLPRNEDVQYLAARQDAGNTTSSASTSSSASASSSSSSSSSSGGGTLNITQSASEDPPNGCSMSNNLSAGQSASWTDTTASSCCVASTSSTCYFRMQSSVSSTERCTIPNCADLASGDSAKMVGFKPLSTTTGSGTQNNTFNITPVNGADRQYGGAKTVWLGAGILACSTLLL